MDRIKSSVSNAIQIQAEQQRSQISHLELQISMKAQEIDSLRMQMQVANSDEVRERQHRGEKDPRNIAPEDALDTIVRLENKLKFEKRRNNLLERENATQKNQLSDRRKALAALQEKCEGVLVATGWNGGRSTAETHAEREQQVEEMIALEAKLRSEHVAGQVIIKKKVNLIEYLQAELAKKRELQEQLNQVYNDIRVTDRDCHEADAEIAKLTKADRGTDSAIVVATNSRDTVALECLEADKRHLAEEITAVKGRRRYQDEVSIAQRERKQRLVARLENVMAAVHDLRVNDARLSSASRGALIPDEQEGDADDIDRIRAASETVPVETYEILHRDLEQVKATVSRKDIMLLEKRVVRESLESKYEDQKAALKSSMAQHEDAKVDRMEEMHELNNDLATKHKIYREQVDQLLGENLKLKSQITKRVPQPGPKKTVNMNFKR